MLTSAIAWRGLAIALLASLAWGGWQWVQLQGARHALAQTEITWTKALVDSMAKARKQEREWQDHADEVAERYEQRLRDVENRYQRRLAGESQRMRDHWLSCTRDGMAGAAESARLSDENARLRRESAARIVRVAEQCDAIVIGWQDFWRGLTQ